MRFRDSLAINVSPILLRLVLGVTFLWAGYGHVFTMAPFSPEQIATLDAMGSAPDNGAADGPLEVIEPGADETNPATKPESTSPESTSPESTTPEAPLPEPAEGEPNAAVPIGADTFRIITVQDSVEDSVNDEADTRAPAVNNRRKLYSLAFMIRNAAAPDEQGKSMLPAFFGQGVWPVRLAWIAAMTELVGGVFVLLGFLTRLSAIGLGVTMLTALWMTAIGPVVIFGAPSSFGFLPAVDDFAVGAWQTWLWQFALLGVSGSLLLAGPGALSADRFLLGRRAAKRARPGARPKPKPAIETDED